MAEYLIKDATLTAIANKTRELTSATGGMTPTEIQSGLDTFNRVMNTAVTKQDDLISNIVAVLNGKKTKNSVAKVSLHTDGNAIVVYIDEDGVECTASGDDITVYALGGVIFCENMSTFNTANFRRLGTSGCFVATNRNYSRAIFYGE